MATSLEAKVYAVPPFVSVQRESADGTRVVYSAVHREPAGCRGAWVVPAERVDESWQPSHDWKTRARRFEVRQDETDPALWRCSASFDFAEVSPDGLDALLLFIGFTPPPVFRRSVVSVERQQEAIASAFEISREAPWDLESGWLKRPLGA